MPSIITHYLFSEEIKEKTNKTIKDQLNQSNKLYHIFSQSFDNLFYYNLLSFKKGKEIRKFGNYTQKSNVNDYFKNLILTIKELHLENNSDVLSYLYGSLTHYILDSTCHPFIIYHSGWMDDKNCNYEFRGNHEKMEVTIDAIYWKEKTGKNLYQESLANILLPKVKFKEDLTNVITITYFKTFQKENMGNIYKKSVVQGHRIIKYFVTDHIGFKKIMYTIFDFIFKKNRLKYQNLSFYNKNPNKKYLNRDHKIWHHPCDYKITSKESFDDLYIKSLKNTIKIFDLTEKVLQNKLDLEEYLKILGNNSYASGLDCSKMVSFKYFKTNNLE